MADSYEIDLEIQGGEQPEIVMETEGGATDGASARNAEAWAAGTRNGVPVGEGDPAYHNNSKYYRDSAAAIAAGDVIDDDAGAGDLMLTWSADKLVGEFGSKHEDMTAGNALFLLSDRGETDNEPYAFRKTGGSKNAYGREMLKKVVGGTIAWNQQMPTRNISITDTKYTIVSNNDGEYTLTVTENGASRGGLNDTNCVTIIDHVYYITFNNPNMWVRLKKDSTDYSLRKIHKSLYGGYNNVSIYFDNLNTGTYIGYLQIFDLTQMFGSTVANEIHAIEQATPGAGVAFFCSLFPKSYYAYDAGTLMSVNAEAHKTVGFNLWDKTNIENGYIDDSDGIAKGLSAGYKHTGYVEVIPGETYYIKSEQTNSTWGAWYDGGKNYLSALTTYSNTTKTAPANARYMRLTIVSPNSGNADTVCINISDTAKNGTYEPYQLRSYPLANVELRGIPKWVDGQMVFDGDEYTPDGTIKRRYGIVDLGTLNYSEYGSTDNVTQYATAGIDAYAKANGMAISEKFIYKSSIDPWTVRIGTGNGRTYLRTTKNAYESTSAFKTAMSGVYLVYELATPTTESADPYRELQISNRNGTEGFTDRAEEAGSRDVAVPVGTETFYPVDVFALIESLQALVLENISNS